MSLSVSSEPDSTEVTVNCSGERSSCSTPPSGPRTDNDRSGVSNVPGAKSVTSIRWLVVSVPSPLESV